LAIDSYSVQLAKEVATPCIHAVLPMRSLLGLHRQGKLEQYERLIEFLHLYKIYNILVKVKLFLCLKVIKYYATKVYGGMDVQIHLFLTSVLAGGEWSAALPPGKQLPVIIQ
jgi:hypothetical protein